MSYEGAELLAFSGSDERAPATRTARLSRTAAVACTRPMKAPCPPPPVPCEACVAVGRSSCPSISPRIVARSCAAPFLGPQPAGAAGGHLLQSGQRKRQSGDFERPGYGGGASVANLAMRVFGSQTPFFRPNSGREIDLQCRAATYNLKRSARVGRPLACHSELTGNRSVSGACCAGVAQW